MQQRIILRLCRFARNKNHIGVAMTDNALHSRLHPAKNEFFLFHGTKGESIKPIACNGFYCSSSGLFGPGVYFAESSTKSDQYTG